MKKVLIILFFILIGLSSFVLCAKAEQTSVSPVNCPIEAQVYTEIVPTEKITLQQAIDLALKNNLDIKNRRLDINKAQNNIKAAGRLQNPSVTLWGNKGQAAIDNPDEYGLVQPIEIGKRSARKNLAKSNLELTKGEVALSEFDLKMDVREAYIDLLAAKSAYNILESQKELLQELVDIAKKKYDAGASPEMDVVQAKMTLGQIMTQINKSRTNIEVARYNFNKTLNLQNSAVTYDTQEDFLPYENDFLCLATPTPEGKLPDFRDISTVASMKRLDIKNAQQSMDVAKKNLTLTIRQRIPDLEVGFGGLYSPDSLTTAIGSQTGYFGLVNVTNIPLLYQYTPEIKNAKIQLEQEELKYCSIKNKAMQDLHSSYDKFLTAQSNLNYYNDALLAESNKFLGMSHKSYLVGKTNITDFIFIEQSYKNIVMGYTNALADYYSAWVEFLREVNDEDIKLDEK